MPTIHFLDVTNRDGVQTARTGPVQVRQDDGQLLPGHGWAWPSPRSGSRSCSTRCPTCGPAWRWPRRGRSVTCGCPAGAGRCPATSRRVGCRSGLRHYNLSISTSDQMIAHKFRGKLDRARDHRRDDRGGRGGRGPAGRRPSGSTPRTGRGPTTGTCWSSRSRPRRPGRRPGPVLRHHRRRHARADQRAVRQARLGRRHPGGDALPQRPGHGRGQLGRPARSATWTPARTPGSTRA